MAIPGACVGIRIQAGRAEGVNSPPPLSILISKFMAALAAEGLAIHQPPIKIISGTTTDEIDDHQIVKGLDGLETACASVQELPKVGIIDDGDLSLAHKHSNARDIGIEELQIQENEPEVPRLTKNLRQASCYISLYISGYK